MRTTFEWNYPMLLIAFVTYIAILSSATCDSWIRYPVSDTTVFGQNSTVLPSSVELTPQSTQHASIWQLANDLHWIETVKSNEKLGIIHHNLKSSFDLSNTVCMGKHSNLDLCVYLPYIQMCMISAVSISTLFIILIGIQYAYVRIFVQNEYSNPEMECNSEWWLHLLENIFFAMILILLALIVIPVLFFLKKYPSLNNYTFVEYSAEWEWDSGLFIASCSCISLLTLAGMHWFNYSFITVTFRRRMVFRRQQAIRINSKEGSSSINYMQYENFPDSALSNVA